MNDDKYAASAEQAAHEALGLPAMQGNLKAVAELAASADSRQQAEHIRGIVATTMAHVSAGASTTTRSAASKWRTWALGLTDGLDEVPGAPVPAGT